jgi:hypothetical protein
MSSSDKYISRIFHCEGGIKAVFPVDSVLNMRQDSPEIDLIFQCVLVALAEVKQGRIKGAFKTAEAAVRSLRGATR